MELMGWPLMLILIIGGFLVFMFLGLPVAFAFALINIIGAALLWGGVAGLQQFILSMYSSVTSFTLATIIFFCLMGDVMFFSGIAIHMIDVLEKLLARLPGRLALVTVAAATLFATMSGSAVGSTVMLGETLVPEMEKRGYSKAMSIGPVVGTGGLAMLIPPTGLGVLMASLASMSVGKYLIAIVVPGFMLAAIIAVYVIVRCLLQPALIPAHEISTTSIPHMAVLTLKYIVPLFLLIFLVLGLIYLGIATPTQSGALGVVGAFLLAAVYRGLNWQNFFKSVRSTLKLTGMIFLIICGATAFSQILAYSGATSGMAKAMLGLPLTPFLIVIVMQVVGLILGCFMSSVSIMMITLPIFVPILNTLHINLFWFCAMYLLNMETGQLTPPFGMLLFVMKGIAKNTTMGEIVSASVPYVLCNLAAMVLMLFFPQLTLWLPGLMSK